MRFPSTLQSALRWLLLAMFMHASVATAQQEPTMSQIYAVAQAGKLDEAQVMLQQVLVAHPKSAKAHFVQSELFARQGNLPKASEALSTAEKLAPGLPFAKPEAVQALRKQLSAPRTLAAPTIANATADTAAKSSNSWLVPALLAAAAIAAGYFIFRRKPAQTFGQSPVPAYGNSNGLNGPQSFGNGGMQAAMQPGMQGGYGQQPMYGQPGYGQPAGGGMGGRIMGGVATGLAVGAGVMAAQAIGRNLMGSPEAGNHATDNGSHASASSNTDMGGQNFGVSDTSWDDAGSSDAGGGDWDN